MNDLKNMRLFRAENLKLKSVWEVEIMMMMQCIFSGLYKHKDTLKNKDAHE